jgi:hypothetical protein
MALTFNPTTLDFGTVAAGTGKRLDVQIHNEGDREVRFTIDGRDSSAFTLSRTSLGPRERKAVSISFRPPAGGSFRASLEATDGNGQKSLPLSGLGRFVLGSDSIDCGLVATGAKNEVEIDVTAPQRGEPWPVAVSPTGAFKVVSPTPIQADGKVHVIRVSFEPTQAVPYTATLTLTGSQLSTRLSGQGRSSPDALPIQLDHDDTDNDGNVDAGEPSRLRIHVPFAETTMVLGRGSTSPKTYDGFGLRTQKRVFIRAEQNVLMQSGGDTVLQAFGGSFYALADDGATLAGKEGANIISPAGTLISSGFGHLSLSDIDGNREKPTSDDDDDGIDALIQSRTAAAVGLGISDAFIAAGVAAYGIRQSYLTIKDAVDSSSRSKKVAGASAVVAGAAGLVAASLSAASAGGASTLGSTTIFGAGGIMLASPTFSSFYSLLGLVNASLYPLTLGLDSTVIGLKSTVIHAGSSLDLYSNRKTHVHSVNRLRLTAGGGFPGFKRPGRINMEAAEILIGKDDSPLPNTERVLITAPAPSEATKNQIELKKDGTLAIETWTKVEIKVGATTLTVTPTEIALSCGGSKLTLDSMFPQLLGALGADLKAKGGATVSARPDGVSISGPKVQIM